MSYIVVLGAISSVLLLSIVLAARAPRGWEDERGFHYGSIDDEPGQEAGNLPAAGPPAEMKHPD